MIYPNVFFSSRCTNGLKASLITDLSNPHIIRNLRVIGLFGKVLTGPWMVQFYGNAAGRKHLEMIPFMRHCVRYLQSLSTDPAILITGMNQLFFHHILQAYEVPGSCLACYEL